MESATRPLSQKYLTLLVVLFLIVAVAVCLIHFTATPASADTYSGTCGDNLTWEYDTSTGVLTISGSGAMKDYSCKISDDKLITSAPWGNFYNPIKKVVISHGVTSIGKNAFYGCKSLTSVTIPDSVTSIGEDAFSYCSSLKYNAKDGVKYLGNATNPYVVVMNADDSITSVVLPNGVTSIGEYAFGCCYSLKSVTIPDSVTSIGEDAFEDCTALASVTIPDSVTSIGRDAFYDCSSLKEVHIQSIEAWCKIDFAGSTSNPLSYAHNLYWNGSLVTDLVIPDSVTSIGNYAFYNCTSLTSVTIPDSVTSIGDYAFRGCTSLPSVTVPDPVISIGNYAFENCISLTSVTIPDSVTSIGEYAFSRCSSLQYNAKDGVYYLGNATNPYVAVIKANTSITSVVLPNGVKCIGCGAFEDCSFLTSLTLPTMEQTLSCLFSSVPTSLKEVTVLGGNICNYAFQNCTSLKSVTIGKSVISIGDSAFSGCSSLTSVTIGNSVTSIGGQAFWGCSSLQYNVKDGVYYLGNATNPYVAVIDADTSITSVVLPNGVKCIGGSAFEDCSALTSVTIGDSVTSIGGYAFEDCSSLTSITIPDSVTSIGDKAFYGCTSLTSVTIGDSVTSIGNYAFQSCSALTSITIPDSVTSIGDYAFRSCSSLASVTIGNSVTSIGERAFHGCTSLASVTIGNSVISIGDSAFSGCSDLRIVYAKGNAFSIGSSAFPSTTPGKFVIYYPTGTSGWTSPTYQGYPCYADAPISDYTTIVSTDANGGYNAQGIYFTLNQDSLTATVGIPGSTTQNNSGYAGAGGGQVVIPERVISNGITYTVRTIAPYAFAGNEIVRSVSLPKSLLSISTHAFDGCILLERFTVQAGNTTLYADATGALYNYGKTRLYYYPAGNLASSYAVLPTVKTIDAGAFSGARHLTSVSIGDSVTSIGGSAFYGCTSLASVTIGNSVTSIEGSAFLDCSALTSITIPDSVTSIGSCAFRDCSSLASITIPNSVTSIGDWAFADCSSLTSITIPFVGGSATASSASASTCFGYIFGTSRYTGGTETKQYYTSSSYATYYIPTSLKEVTVTGGQLFYGAFYDCNNLASITIPDSVTSIGNYAFYRCSSLTSITIPDSVTSIGDYAFYNCTSLTSIIIPDSVTSIGEDAFSGCSNLQSILIGKNVSSMTGTAGLKELAKLAKISVDPENAYFSSDAHGVLYNKNKTTLILYPRQRSWYYYTIPDGVTTVEAGAFTNCYNLICLTIPKSVNTFGSSAITGCSSAVAYVYSGSKGETYANSLLSSGHLASVVIMDDMTFMEIQVAQEPYRKIQYLNSVPDFDGLFILGIFDGGAIAIDDYTLLYDMSRLGKQTVTVSYQRGGQTYTASFEIEVKEKDIDRIEVTKPADQVTFVEGADMNTQGLVVVVVYTDGSTEVITDYTLTYDTSVIGAGKVTVTYRGKYTASYDITVNQKQLTHITVADGSVNIYPVFSTLQDLQLVINAHYDNGKAYPVSDYTVTGFTTDAAGTKTLTITYQGVSCTYQVEVTKLPNNTTPVAPKLENLTDSTIALVAINGYEYSLDGKTWQDSPVFEDLVHFTTYTVYQRVVATDTVEASVASTATFTTLYPISGYLTINGTYLYGETLTANTANVIPEDAVMTYTWYRNGVAIPGATGNSYTIVKEDIGAEIHVEGIATGSYGGKVVSPSVTPAKAAQSATDAPVVETITHVSVTLVAIPGGEYSLDGHMWQDSPVFEGLQAKTSYTFYQRLKESDTHTVGVISKALTVTTLECPHTHYTQVAEIPATCTTDGVHAHRHCTDCDTDLLDGLTTLVIPALGHDLTQHAAQAVTCTTHGWAAYETCSRCDHTTYREIPALGHDIVHHNAQNVSCTQVGWAAYDACSRCDYSTYREIPALGHDIVHHVAQAPTCDAIGWEAYETCSRCDYTTRVVIPVLGHDLISHEGKPATCTEGGWVEYVTCSRCDFSTYAEIPALGHDIVHHAAQAPTCEGIGWDAYDTCSRCDYATPYVEHSALGHDIISHDAKAPTCTENGWEAYEGCSRCDYAIARVDIPALGHDLTQHAGKAPTCTEGGWAAYETCSRCSHTTYQAISNLGHDWEHLDEVPASCEGDGSQAYDVCKRCGKRTKGDNSAALFAGSAVLSSLLLAGWYFLRRRK